MQIRLMDGFGNFCAAALFALATAAAANADTTNKNITHAKRAMPQKSCYTYNSTSASPQPCERIRGQAPTTALPMVVIRYR